MNMPISRYIVGLLFLANLCISNPAAITLKTTSTDGQPLQEAGAGQPFLLHVSLSNVHNTAQYPVVKVDGDTKIQQSGFQMNMVNGATSISYHYHVRIDTPGTHTIGPAQIMEPSGTVESPPLTITVSDSQKVHQSGKQTNGSKSFARLTCDTQKLYVGQKAHCTLTFYTDDPLATLQQQLDPDNCASQFECCKKEGPVTGTKMINGTHHRYAQWEWDMCPKKAGTQVIPAYALDYTTQTKTPFFSFFSRSETKRAYSNTVSLEVEPLPVDSNFPNPFIGTIQELTGKLEPNHAKVGNGITFTLTLTGQGNFDRLSSFALTGIPENLKVYESKRYQEPVPNGAHRYSIEYIIQALQPGSITVPAQKITYFDVAQRAYKTVQSFPLTLQIFANPKQARGSAATPGEEKPGKQINTVMRPLREEGPWSPQAPLMVPWHIFWALTILLSMLYCAQILFMVRHYFYNLFAPLVKKRNSSLYHRLRQIEKTGEYHQLYPLFMEILATKLGASLSAETIEQLLQQKGFKENILEEWRTFFEQLTMARFAHTDSSQRAWQRLVKQVIYWIDIFEHINYHRKI